MPKNWGIQSNVKGEDLKISNLVGGRNRVFVDFVINCDHVFELKVVRMPRKISTSSRGSLYDVGQILTDIDRAYRANVKSINALILLYGPLVEDLASSNAIIREFHDRCYLDISKSALWGDLNSERKIRKGQVKMIKMLGFDKPFSGKATKNIRCYFKNKYAILHIQL